LVLGLGLRARWLPLSVRPGGPGRPGSRPSAGPGHQSWTSNRRDRSSPERAGARHAAGLPS